MTDEFDASELLMAIDQFEGNGMPPHLVERLKDAVALYDKMRAMFGEMCLKTLDQPMRVECSNEVWNHGDSIE